MTDRLDQAIMAAQKAVRQLSVDYDGGPHEELMLQYARALITDLIKGLMPEYGDYKLDGGYAWALDDLCERAGIPEVHRVAIENDLTATDVALMNGEPK